MLITQYEAGKRAGVTRQAIHFLLQKNPKPLYFVKLEKGWKVDDDHPLWKSYLQQKSISKKEDNKFKDLLMAVYSVIKEKFDLPPEELGELMQQISDRAEL